MKILITGVNGFVGHHLVNQLLADGHVLGGVGLQPQPAAGLGSKLDDYYSLDLTDPAQVKHLPLQQYDGVISLAGLANVAKSFDEPELYLKVNTAVINNVSMALLNSGKAGQRHLAISTGAVYDSTQTPPFTESSSLAAEASPYVMSKIAMEKACADYRSRGLEIIIVRPFNHIGPGQEKGFLLPDLYERVKDSLSSGDPVEVGNLKTSRDYTDVRDVVRAYAALLTQPNLTYGVYNVCSGHGVQGQQILDHLLEALGAAGKIEVKINQKLIRPNDPPEIFGSNQRLHKETGWQPSFSLKQTVADFVHSK